MERQGCPDAPCVAYCQGATFISDFLHPDGLKTLNVQKYVDASL
jgi:hypothetical protein